MREFASAVFNGNFYETRDYLRDNHSNDMWNCPTGKEDVEGIIEVLFSGCENPQNECFEIDYFGNIRIPGELQIFAYAE